MRIGVWASSCSLSSYLLLKFLFHLFLIPSTVPEDSMNNPCATPQSGAWSPLTIARPTHRLCSLDTRPAPWEVACLSQQPRLHTDSRRLRPARSLAVCNLLCSSSFCSSTFCLVSPSKSCRELLMHLSHSILSSSGVGDEVPFRRLRSNNQHKFQLRDVPSPTQATPPVQTKTSRTESNLEVFWSYRHLPARTVSDVETYDRYACSATMINLWDAPIAWMGATRNQTTSEFLPSIERSANLSCSRPQLYCRSGGCRVLWNALPLTHNFVVVRCLQRFFRTLVRRR